MKNVKRLKIPISLFNNSAKWTEILLDEIERCKGIGKKASDKFFEKYRKDDVVERLGEMYNECCCYCERKIISTPDHIDHRKPKRKFPKSTYEWENLHWSCGGCNNKKGQKYDKKNTILDAVVDNPLDEHLVYDTEFKQLIDTKKLMYEFLSPRGETTISHTDLNRKKIAETRMDVYVLASEFVHKIRRTMKVSKTKTKHLLDKFSNYQKGEFGSVFTRALKDL